MASDANKGDDSMKVACNEAGLASSNKHWQIELLHERNCCSMCPDGQVEVTQLVIPQAVCTCTTSHSCVNVTRQHFDQHDLHRHADRHGFVRHQKRFLQDIPSQPMLSLTNISAMGYPEELASLLTHPIQLALGRTAYVIECMSACQPSVACQATMHSICYQ